MIREVERLREALLVVCAAARDVLDARDDYPTDLSSGRGYHTAMNELLFQVDEAIASTGEQT